MSPTLVLIRHAEAEHNDYSIHDPDLTELGTSQCRELAEQLKDILPGRLEPELIIVSPMKRCLQTALIGLEYFINEKKVPIVAHAGWQENSAKECDVGSPIETLSKEYPAVDFTKVDPVYPDKTSPAGSHYAYNRAAILNRAQTSLAELSIRPEKVIAVVSHSGFMRAGVTGCFYMNADYRIFDYAERASEDEPYRLVQWEETKTKSGGRGLSWSNTVTLGDGVPQEDTTL